MGFGKTILNASISRVSTVITQTHCLMVIYLEQNIRKFYRFNWTRGVGSKLQFVDTRRRCGANLSCVDIGVTRPSAPTPMFD